MTDRGRRDLSTRVRSGRAVAAAGATMLLVALIVAAARLAARPGPGRQPGGPLEGRPPSAAVRAPQPEAASAEHSGNAANARPAGLSRAGEADLRRGIGAMEQSRWPAAAQAFARAAHRDPRSPLAHDYLGIAYLRQGRYPTALEQFREEIRLDPLAATGWARVADVYHAQGKEREAIRALEQFVHRSHRENLEEAGGTALVCRRG